MGLSINGQSPIAGWFIIVNFHPTASHAGNAGHCWVPRAAGAVSELAKMLCTELTDEAREVNLGLPQLGISSGHTNYPLVN